MPFGHCLLPSQVQPDGVTLKYNDYAWNKVWAQALPPWLRGEGGPELVPLACAMEPIPAAPFPGSLSSQVCCQDLAGALGQARHPWVLLVASQEQIL